MNNKYFIFLLVFLAFALSVSAADWTQFMANAAHSGANGDLGPGASSVIKWDYSFRFSEPIIYPHSPLIKSNRLYQVINENYGSPEAGSGSYLYVFNPNEGTQLAKCKINLEYSKGNGAIFNQDLYLPLSNGIIKISNIHLLNLLTGQDCGGSLVVNNISPVSSLVEKDGVLYFGGSLQLYKYVIATSQLSNYPAGAPVLTPVLTEGMNGKRYVIFIIMQPGGANRYLQAVDASNLAATTSGTFIFNPASDIVASPAVYSPSGDGFNLITVALKDGRIFNLQQNKLTGGIGQAGGAGTVITTGANLEVEPIIHSESSDRGVIYTFTSLYENNKMYKLEYTYGPSSGYSINSYTDDSHMNTYWKYSNKAVASPAYASNTAILVGPSAITGFNARSGFISTITTPWNLEVPFNPVATKLSAPAISEDSLFIFDGKDLFAVGTASSVPAPSTPLPQPEICTDGLDNDEDTLVDCDDSDCATAVNCQPEVPPSVPPPSGPLYGDYNGDGSINIGDWVQIRQNPAAFWQAMEEDIITLNNYLVAMKRGWTG